MIQKVKKFILSHKIISIAVLVIVVGVGVYLIVHKSNNSEASYTTEIVKRGDITTSVTGTGQVEASDTITLSPKTQGDVTYIGVKAGDYVKKGTLILSVDSRDAKSALQSAELSLKELTTVDSLDLLKEENSLKESYDSGWNEVSSYITDTTSLIDEVDTMYSSSGYLGYQNIKNLSSSGREKVSQAEDDFYKAKDNFEDLVKLYKTLSRTDSNEQIKNLIKKSYDSSIVVAKAVKSTETAFNYVVDSLDKSDADVSTERSGVNSWLSTSNKYTNNLLSVYNNINENEGSLVDLKAGAGEIDIRQAELTLQNKQNAYNDCFLYAPFDGVVATLTAKVGESSGSSIGSIITKQKVVTISLNEVDISSVKTGQKATLTFDAIDGLSVGGTVVEIDSVGTVSSGVVTYDVKIALDNDDERVKPGMSTNVEITTDSRQNILVVSSSAIKTRSDVSYVEVLDKNTNQTLRKNVEVGISDDTTTEIISGLSEGDVIISKTSTNNSSASSSSSNNNKDMMGGSMMGGAVGGPMMK